MIQRILFGCLAIITLQNKNLLSHFVRYNLYSINYNLPHNTFIFLLNTKNLIWKKKNETHKILWLVEHKSGTFTVGQIISIHYVTFIFITLS